MRRFEAPYNNQRYLLNRNTHEVHDLDRETDLCRINEIETSHIYCCDSYDEAMLASVMFDNFACNGCAYCMPEQHKD